MFGFFDLCKGRLKSIFLFLVQKVPQLIKQGRSAQCQLPVLGQYSAQVDRSDSVPHSGTGPHFPMRHPRRGTGYIAPGSGQTVVRSYRTFPGRADAGIVPGPVCHCA